MIRLSDEIDYRCINLGAQDEQNKSWCGRSTSCEWAFVDVTHAALASRNGSGISICPNCSKQVVLALKNITSSEVILNSQIVYSTEDYNSVDGEVIDFCNLTAVAVAKCARAQIKFSSTCFHSGRISRFPRIGDVVSIMISKTSNEVVSVRLKEMFDES